MRSRGDIIRPLAELDSHMLSTDRDLLVDRWILTRQAKFRIALDIELAGNSAVSIKKYLQLRRDRTHGTPWLETRLQGLKIPNYTKIIYKTASLTQTIQITTMQFLIFKTAISTIMETTLGKREKLSSRKTVEKCAKKNQIQRLIIRVDLP